MSLAEATGQCCTRPIAPERFAYRDTIRRRDSQKLGAVQAALQGRIEELKAAGQVCDEVLGLLHELEDLTHDPQRFNQRLFPTFFFQAIKPGRIFTGAHIWPKRWKLTWPLLARRHWKAQCQTSALPAN